MEYIGKIPSPVGLLTVASDGSSLTGLWLEGQKYYGATLDPETEEKSLPVFDRTAQWLELYFGGKQPDLAVPLSPKGSPFRQAVWKALCEIPYGTVVSYGDLAKRMNEAGAHTSPRAVGGAVGHNPISILIPCHRVVGASGGLTGYAGGLDRKIQLLRLERAKLEALRNP